MLLLLMPLPAFLRLSLHLILKLNQYEIRLYHSANMGKQALWKAGKIFEYITDINENNPIVLLRKLKLEIQLNLSTPFLLLRDMQNMRHAIQFDSRNCNYLLKSMSKWIMGGTDIKQCLVV